jgi:ubiquinone biosynthesis protein COQ4
MMNPVDVFRGLRAVSRVVRDPNRLDEIFVLADLSEKSQGLEQAIERFKADPVLAAAFERKPRLGPVNQEALHRLPEGTLGREYADFMAERGLRHEDLKLVESGDERDIDWIRNHLRETHDLWHVVTGFDTDIPGELGLQAFYCAQVKGPLPVLILSMGLLNTLFMAMETLDDRMTAISHGYQLGKETRSLFGLDFRAHFDRPLTDLRRELGLPADAPSAVRAALAA